MSRQRRSQGSRSGSCGCQTLMTRAAPGLSGRPWARFSTTIPGCSSPTTNPTGFLKSRDGRICHRRPFLEKWQQREFESRFLIHSFGCYKQEIRILFRDRRSVSTISFREENEVIGLINIILTFIDQTYQRTLCQSGRFSATDDPVRVIQY